ncbi:alpha/beta hydrolase family protein [Acidobacteriota bacterium]
MESIDESPENWRVEKVSFNAAYSNERMIAYLYLPKYGTPPYQTAVFFPGSNAISLRSHGERIIRRFDYILETGRAVMFPILKGTFERNDGLTSTWPNTSYRYVEYLIKWVKDFKRSIDYLEIRRDIDINRLAYLGFSWGGRMGAIIPAVEPRLKTSILYVGGLASGRARPEVDQINYITRVTIPTLMLNGKYDPIEPYEKAQLPMYRLLGSPDEDKNHIFYETDHGVPRNASIKETLSWLDRYLGQLK